jgi:glycosyltransferase involved in cell wall biosynthesis
MPTLNEVEGLKAVLPGIDRKLFQEIIVADGNSTDGTIEFCREQDLRVVFQNGKGLPNAYECALSATTADAVVIYTPDGNSKADLLPVICEELRNGYDMVVASRYLGEARSYDDDALTALGNRLFTWTVNFLFGVKFTDVLVGLRGYRRDAMERMGLPRMSYENWLRKRFLYMNSWELGASLRAARLGLKVFEIPGDEPKRIGGTRKLSIIKNGTGGLLQVIDDFLFFGRHL